MSKIVAKNQKVRYNEFNGLVDENAIWVQPTVGHAPTTRGAELC